MMTWTLVGYWRVVLTAGLIALTGTTLAGCSAGKTASRAPAVARPTENGQADCFYIRDVQDFRTLGRTDLIVYAPTGKHAFQVRIAPPATGLRFSEAVAFVSRSNRICGYAGDSLVVNEAGGAQRYSVVEVARLTPETVARLLEKHDQPAPEGPESAKGGSDGDPSGTGEGADASGGTGQP